MDDLISRSAVKEEIESLTMTITGLRSGKSMFRDFMNEYRKSVLRIIDEQPTAYNVDKVVEQLEARKTLDKSIQEKAMDHAMFGGVKYMQPIVETIEEDLKIVKTGGGTE